MFKVSAATKSICCGFIKFGLKITYGDGDYYDLNDFNVFGKFSFWCL